VSFVSLCEYGGGVFASVEVDDSWAEEFVDMLELLFGETHYAVLDEHPSATF
jgi:hypothetical protein